MKTELNSAIEHYLQWKSTYTERAFINYRPWLVRFAASVPEKVVENITLDDIVKFRLWMDNKYQPYTIQLAMVSVHNFLKWCNMMKYDTIPAGLVRIQRTQARPRPVVYLKDYEKILSFYKGKNDFISVRNHLIMRLLWDTGVRISELCDLNIDTVNLETREASIRTRKSHKMRQIFWSTETNALLIQYLGPRLVLSSSNSLFIGTRGVMTTRLKPRMIQRVIVDLSNELKLGKKITPHSFRHGKAHRILDLGGNPKHIQAILGHSEMNPMASFHYMQYNNEETRIAGKRFLGEKIDLSQLGEDSGNVAKSS